MLPTPANLVRWKVSENNKCRCGKLGTLRHILSACPLGLKQRYTWRHNQVLRVFLKYLEEKIREINEGKIPTTEVRKKIEFHKEGQRGSSKLPASSTVKDNQWKGSWKISADLDKQLVFPVTVTTQRPDLTIWDENKKHVIIMELTVPWEENIEKAEERKEQRYADLVNVCREKGWETEYYHLAVGCRGYVDRKIAKLFCNRFKLQPTKLKKMIKELQETAEKNRPYSFGRRETMELGLNEDVTSNTVEEVLASIQCNGNDVIIRILDIKPLWHNVIPSPTSVMEVKHRPIDIFLGWGTNVNRSVFCA